MAKKFKEIEVNDPVKVKVLNKYWLQGTVIALNDNIATIRVSAYYGYSDAFLIKDEKKNLKPILLKEDKK